MTYSTVKNMGGTWAVVSRGKYGLNKVVLEFNKTEAGGAFYLCQVTGSKKGKCCKVPRECMIWNNKHVRCEAMEDAGINWCPYSEKDNKVTVYDDENRKPVLELSRSNFEIREIEKSLEIKIVFREKCK